MQTIQQLRRLRKLIKYLEHIEQHEPEVFDLCSWFSGGTGATLFEWRKRHKQRKPLNCGTTACVVGHMAVIFNEFEWNRKNNLEKNVVVAQTGQWVGKAVLASFFGGTCDVWEAVIYDAWYRCGSGNTKLSDVLARLRLIRDSTDIHSFAFLTTLLNTHANEPTN